MTIWSIIDGTVRIIPILYWNSPRDFQSPVNKTSALSVQSGLVRLGEAIFFRLGEAIFLCMAPGFFSNDITHNKFSKSWFKSDLMDKTFLSEESFVYCFSIIIPEDQNLKGSFWTLLMVNIEKPIKEELSNNKISLDTKISYAVGLITNVGSQGNPNLDFMAIYIKKSIDNIDKK
eukprot:TRINITY_DN998_c0_g1_i4.p1 TRINITY_DN998_c0_g1~~TRINITY_DN998_c0_g1_i4.p1  ORF type:complete len:175 (-),score=15.13 TRINITY_DN998_c0_g1_i4:618-1142(-)